MADIRLYGLGNDSIAADAGIRQTKLEHRHVHTYSQSGTVAAATAIVIGRVYGATGQLLRIDAVCNTAPTTTDTVTIDVKKSSGGTAYATVLSGGGIVFNSSSIDRVSQSAAINSSSLTVGDVVEVVVTVSGTSAVGLGVTLVWSEVA